MHAFDLGAIEDTASISFKDIGAISKIAPILETVECVFPMTQAVFDKVKINTAAGTYSQLTMNRRIVVIIIPTVSLTNIHLDNTGFSL